MSLQKDKLEQPRVGKSRQELLRKNIGWISVSVAIAIIGISALFKESSLSIRWTWALAGAALGSGLTYWSLNTLNQRHRLKEMASSDPLTPERRFFDQYLTQRILERQNMALLLCNLDFFSQFNDTYGRTIGDQCLNQIHGLLRESVRKGDFVTQLGPDTFVVFLPNTEEHIAINIAERVRSQVERLNIPHGTSKVSHVMTISGGLAFCKRDEIMTSGEFLDAATHLLALSKQRGRNQITNRLQGIFAEMPDEADETLDQ